MNLEWFIGILFRHPSDVMVALLLLMESVCFTKGMWNYGNQLSQESGSDPQPEHIAEACNLDLDEVINLLGIVEQPVSLDTPLDDEARYTFADTLEDTVTPAPAEAASRHLIGEELQRALTLLTPRERSAITLRYGIGDGRSRTLLEVGKKLGISRERVRQLEAAALKKMRSRLAYE